MVVLIRRERYKGSYRVVVRVNGKIDASAKWNRRLTLPYAKYLYDKNKTLNPNLVRESYALTNVKEYTLTTTLTLVGTEFKRHPNVRLQYKKGSVQYIVQVLLKNGSKISSRSRSIYRKMYDGTRQRQLSLNDARSEAWESVMRKIAGIMTGYSDVDEYYKNNLYTEIVSVKEGLVYYNRY